MRAQPDHSSCVKFGRSSSVPQHSDLHPPVMELPVQYSRAAPPFLSPYGTSQLYSRPAAQPRAPAYSSAVQYGRTGPLYSRTETPPPSRLVTNTEYIFLLEMKNGQYICPLSRSVHFNFTGDSKCNEKVWACPPPHPHQPGLILPS